MKIWIAGIEIVVGAMLIGLGISDTPAGIDFSGWSIPVVGGLVLIFLGIALVARNEKGDTS